MPWAQDTQHQGQISTGLTRPCRNMKEYHEINTFLQLGKLWSQHTLTARNTVGSTHPYYRIGMIVASAHLYNQ